MSPWNWCIPPSLRASLLVFATLAMIPANALAGDTTHFGALVIGDTPGEILRIAASDTYIQFGDVTVTGTGSLQVLGTLRLTGSLNVEGGGRVTVDGGEFHIHGDYTNIELSGNSVLKFQNNALFHYVQSFVIQHILVARDTAQIQLTDTIVDCDGSTEAVYLYDFSAYLATNLRNATPGQWRTWYMENSSSLSLRNVPSAGDIVFYDDPSGGPNLYFENSSQILPWLHFDAGLTADLRFPAVTTPDDAVSYSISNNVNGVTGIHWTLRVVNCTHVGWGLDPFPGSNVTVRDSYLTMVMWRYRGTESHDLQGFMVADSQYGNETVPATDRNLRLINTHVLWWKVDVWDDAELHADSIVFAEMIVQDRAKAFVKNSICEGQTIHLGVVDDAYAEFENGEVWSFVSVWNHATLVLRDSLVDWQKGQYLYQTTNIAHQDSRLYCINTTLREPPQAYDRAVALVAQVDPLPPGTPAGPIPITGSAWLESPGPVAFSHYQLFHAPGASESWTQFAESTSQVHSGPLGVLDASGFPPGQYRIKLVVSATGETTPYPVENYPALRDFSISPNCASAPNGTFCDDGNACTRSDSCQAGACTGANPVICVPSDACHTAGVCTPGTGHCSNPARPSGTPCDDANICSANDRCNSAGTCVGGPAPNCDDVDACTADICEPLFGCVHGAADMAPEGFSQNRVDGLDLLVLARAWNSCAPDPRYNAAADLDPASSPAGACVDGVDFHLFMMTFGRGCS